VNNEQEKKYIVEQRALGQTFGQIGKTLGRSEDAVRKIYIRAINDPTLKSNAADIDKPSLGGVEICKNCGKPLVKVPKGEKCKFCSNHCRFTWWNKQKRKTPYSLTCEFC